MYCKQCGKENKDDSTFCVNCGALLKKKEYFGKDKILILVICFIIISCFIVSLIPVDEYYNSELLSSTDTSSSTMTNINNYITLNDITVYSNSSYTYCTGNIKLSPLSPTGCSYIKVKGSFKNSYGTVIDTDWTYAVGSEGLEPGESKKFSLSVEKDSSIKDCSVTILED